MNHSDIPKASRPNQVSMKFPAHWLLLIFPILLIACSSNQEKVKLSSESSASTGMPNSEETTQSAPTKPAPKNMEPTTYAGIGKGGFSGDGEAATNAELFEPQGLAVDNDKNLFISGDNRVRLVNASSGIITTVAGTGSPGYRGDGGLATEALLKNPRGIALDSENHLYIADTSNGRIRKVDAVTGIITTVAGGGMPKRVNGVLDIGDGKPATDAWFKEPMDVSVDKEGNFYFTSDKSRIRKVDVSTGIITTIAGTGIFHFSGDGGPAVEAEIGFPYGLTVDDQGNVYISDTYNHRIRKVDATTGIISTVAGIGEPGEFKVGVYSRRLPGAIGGGYSGDNGPAVNAMIHVPEGIVIGPDKNLYFADTGNDRIRKVDLSTGIISTVIDGGAVKGKRMETGFQDSGELEVTFTRFSPPTDLAISPDNETFIIDPLKHRVVSVIKSP